MTEPVRPALPPIERSVRVSWAPDAAFERFTARFGEWWPVRTHSIGERRVARVVFEQRVGGKIYEEHTDGRRFQWGEVLEWEPPRRVRFRWSPSRPPETAQDVEVTFVPDGAGAGTLVTLTSWGWERWGKGAKAARRGYSSGWGYVLNVWAGRRTAGMALTETTMLPLALTIQWARGGLDAAIARAAGELPRTSAAT